jgi:hypothetical protein
MTYGPPPGNPPEQPGGAGTPPPPPPPPGEYGAPQPGGYGAPQPGGYGQPSQYGQPTAAYPAQQRSGFDFASVNRLDWGIMAAGVLALIFSFFSYYSYTYKGQFKDICGNDCSRTTGGWSGFFGWFGVLLALIGAALVALAVFRPSLKLPVPARLAALGAFVLALLFTLLALLVVPNYNGLSGADYNRIIDEGHSFSYWIVLIVILVGAVLSFLRFQQTGGDLAAVFNSARSGASQGHGQPQPGGGYQQQGYPQQGYQPQGYQPPPPGYQQPQAPQPQPPQPPTQEQPPPAQP